MIAKSESQKGKGFRKKPKGFPLKDEELFKKLLVNPCLFQKCMYICIHHKKGALAHLARALDWQSKGDEFESRMLHSYNRLY